MRVSPEDFVRAWQAGTSALAVAQQLGMTRVAARSRAALYRRMGVPLQEFSSSPALDVEQLTKLARGSV